MSGVPDQQFMGYARRQQFRVGNCAVRTGLSTVVLRASHDQRNRFHCWIFHQLCHTGRHIHGIPRPQQQLHSSLLLPALHPPVLHPHSLRTHQVNQRLYLLHRCMYISFNSVFGLILGALVNTLFSSIFSIHSVWSLVIF